MILDLQSLLTLFGIICISCFFYWSIGIEEIALKAALYKCRQLDLQLLDQTLEFKGMQLFHPISKRPGLWRQYAFDFSTGGDDRYEASLLMNGRRLISFDIPTHRFEQNLH